MLNLCMSSVVTKGNVISVHFVVPVYGLISYSIDFFSIYGTLTYIRSNCQNTEYSPNNGLGITSPYLIFLNIFL